MSKISKHLYLKQNRALAPLLLVGVLVCSCLVPQPEIVSPALPPLANRPISISKAIPSIQGSVRIGACGSDEFSITVDDADHAQDYVRSLWFVDPQSDLSLSVLVQGGLRAEPSPNDSRTVDCPKAVLTALANRFDGKPHRLSVYITDGEFVESTIEATQIRRNLPVSEGGTAYFVDATTDSYNWTVEVIPCP